MRISLRKFEVEDNAAPGTGEPRKGFILIEVIVAMVILAIAVSSLAALMYSVSQSGMLATANAYKNGVLMYEVNRLEGIPYASIEVTGTAGTEVTVTTPPYRHTRVIKVSEPVANVVKTVEIVIIPSNTKFKPDTVSFTRTNARSSRVLCTTSCPQTP